MWTDISRGISRWPANAWGCRPLGSSGKRPLKPHLDGPTHPPDGCRAGRASPQAQWSGMGFVNSGALARNPAACSQMSTQEDWRHTADWMLVPAFLDTCRGLSNTRRAVSARGAVLDGAEKWVTNLRSRVCAERERQTAGRIPCASC